MVAKADGKNVLYLILATVLPLLTGILLAVFTTGGNILGIILWSITALLAGVLGFMLVLGRIGTRVAYSRIEGQPGAVGAVLRSQVRRGWRANEIPVAVSPKTQDAVYRLIGKGGVVLVGEGPRSRTNKLVQDEQKRTQRSVPQVPVNIIWVGPDEGSTPLHKINSALGKLPKKLNKLEVSAAANRLEALTNTSMPIPKGIDPYKVRAPKPR